MIPRPAVCPGTAHESQIVALRAAGGEIKLLFLHLQIAGDKLHRLPHIFLGIHALIMKGRRIPVMLCHNFIHQLCRALVAAGRS